MIRCALTIAHSAGVLVKQQEASGYEASASAVVAKPTSNPRIARAHDDRAGSRRHIAILVTYHRRLLLMLIPAIVLRRTLAVVALHLRLRVERLLRWRRLMLSGHVVAWMGLWWRRCGGWQICLVPNIRQRPL